MYMCTSSRGKINRSHSKSEFQMFSLTFVFFVDSKQNLTFNSLFTGVVRISY